MSTAERDVDTPSVIAVDGLSGVGKSTVSRQVARELGWSYLDTGATYRAVTLAALRAGLLPVGADTLDRPGDVVALATRAVTELAVGTGPTDYAVRLGAQDVTREIRGDDVSASVSAVSAEPRVRTLLVGWQRRIASAAVGCVVEGRDVGTVVLPTAPLKVWLTAEAAARASRRAADPDAAGGSLAAVQAGIDRRDGLDVGRTAAPAEPAADAVLIDSSSLGIDEVVAAILDLAASRGIQGTRGNPGAAP